MYKPKAIVFIAATIHRYRGEGLTTEQVVKSYDKLPVADQLTIKRYADDYIKTH